jgi:ParB family transcriptional regulator, chromosome partitioning protein
MAMPEESRSRLGRGLAALIGDIGADNATMTAERARNQRRVPIEYLKPNPRNPRKSFSEAELEELAASIKERGIIQPVVVRAVHGAKDAYEIIAGERRWRAAQRVGQHEVPILLMEVDDRASLEIAIVENVQRTDLNAIEEATGYNDLTERFGYTQEQLADVIGKSRSHIANTLRLLKLPAAVRSLLADGSLTAGHARALVGREDAEALARRIVAQDLNVRAVEALVQSQGKGKDGAGGDGRRGTDKDADTRAFEKDLADVLGLKVEIKPGPGESGTLTIRYGNFDQLDYIRSRLVG